MRWFLGQRLAGQAPRRNTKEPRFAQGSLWAAVPGGVTAWPGFLGAGAVTALTISTCLFIDSFEGRGMCGDVGLHGQAQHKAWGAWAPAIGSSEGQAKPGCQVSVPLETPGPEGPVRMTTGWADTGEAQAAAVASYSPSGIPSLHVPAHRGPRPCAWPLHPRGLDSPPGASGVWTCPLPRSGHGGSFWG